MNWSVFRHDSSYIARLGLAVAVALARVPTEHVLAWLHHQHGVPPVPDTGQAVSEVAWVSVVLEVSVVALIGEQLRALRHCKLWRYGLHRLAYLFVQLGWLFFGLQTPFLVPLEPQLERLLALEHLLDVQFLPLTLSSRVASFPNQ